MKLLILETWFLIFKVIYWLMIKRREINIWWLSNMLFTKLPYLILTKVHHVNTIVLFVQINTCNLERYTSMSQTSESGFSTSIGGTTPQLLQCPRVKWTQTLQGTFYLEYYSNRNSTNQHLPRLNSYCASHHLFSCWI